MNGVEPIEQVLFLQPGNVDLNLREINALRPKVLKSI